MRRSVHVGRINKCNGVRLCASLINILIVIFFWFFEGDMISNPSHVGAAATVYRTAKNADLEFLNNLWGLVTE